MVAFSTRIFFIWLYSLRSDVQFAEAQSVPPGTPVAAENPTIQTQLENALPVNFGNPIRDPTNTVWTKFYYFSNDKYVELGVGKSISYNNGRLSAD